MVVISHNPDSAREAQRGARPCLLFALRGNRLIDSTACMAVRIIGDRLRIMFLNHLDTMRLQSASAPWRIRGGSSFFRKHAHFAQMG